jgi:hypothetical protein
MHLAWQASGAALSLVGYDVRIPWRQGAEVGRASPGGLGFLSKVARRAFGERASEAQSARPI